MIVRALSFASIACLVGGVALIVFDDEGIGATAVGLLLASFAITTLLGIRAAFHKASGVVSDARTFISGDIQHARLVSVGDPKGIFTPESTVVLELEGEDGTVHNFERDIPVPFPMAWGHRLGKRFNVPLISTDLTRLMAFELKREGMNVSVAGSGGGEAPLPEEDQR